MVKILHFADAHIDMANYGRRDPESGLPMRVLDFLNSLDQIVDAAIEQQVDLVIFAGDAYKDRNPAPTFQREWGRRMMRLSNASIATILLVGNHDLSPNLGRAHALEEFNTLEVPHIQVADRPRFYTPDDLNGLPVQVLALPWISRSGMVAYLDMKLSSSDQIYAELEEKINNIVADWLENADPGLPIVLTAHASIQGASYGGERTVMLGGDLVLSGGLVKSPQLDYVALGHIHKAQDLNEGQHPPVIYPGSIERVDFGEARDDKFYVIADVKKGATEVSWQKIADIRRFLDCYKIIDNEENITEQLRQALPTPEEMQDAIVRLTIEYPRDWEALIDEAALREITANAFELHLIKRPVMEARIRLPEDKNVGSMTPVELLEIYWKSAHIDSEERGALLELAQEIIEHTTADEIPE